MKKIAVFLFLGLAFQCLFAQTGQQDKTTMKPALLVIDVQKQFLPMMSKEDQDRALEMINWSIWMFRKYDLPVIRIYHTSDKWGPKPGEPGFEFGDSVKVLPSDAKVVKTYGSGFNKTDLDKILKEKGINTLFLCGLSAVGCVLATYEDAANYDYTAFLIRDALLSQNAQYTDQVETIFNALDLETINYMLKIRRE
ncbi:MAG TPA: isochorismatase family cysteine hydrolase [Bacteroidales bacterium]|nr:isochorismatase family cysteine hydrolase [Bacteroidales bacterium]